MFAWRLGHDLLPTNVKIATINKNFNSDCPRCNSFNESLVHALRDCSYVRELLELGGVENRVLSLDWNTRVDWLEFTMRLVDSIVRHSNV